MKNNMINDVHVNMESVLPYVFYFKTLVGLPVCPGDSKNGGGQIWQKKRFSRDI